MEERPRARLSPSEGRRFSASVGFGLLAIAGILRWRNHEVAALVVAAAGASLLLAGLVVPTRLGPVRRSWMRMGRALSRVTTPLFLGVLYFGVLTPIGVLRRVAGSNPMVHEAEEGSYWRTRPQERRQSDLRRQY